MPYQALRLNNGVDVSETPALNQAGVSTSQLVRYKPDPTGAILIEKLGGWDKFYATQITSIVRVILGWQDTNSNKWIAFGSSGATDSPLLVVKCNTDGYGKTTASGGSFLITPQFYSVAIPVNFSTTAGSSTVVVTDNVVTGLTSVDSVYISTPVSVGGLILSGQYSITPITTNTYSITATNTLGTPAYAAYSTLVSPIAVTGGSYSSTPSPRLTLSFATQTSAPFLFGETVNITGISPSTWNGSCIVISCTTTQVVVYSPLGASGSWSSGGSLANSGSVPVVSTTVGTNDITVQFSDNGQSIGNTFSVVNQSVVDITTLFGNYQVDSTNTAFYFHFFGPGAGAVTSAAAYLGAQQIVGGSSTTSAVTLTLGNGTFYPPIVTVTGGSSTTSAVTLTWPLSSGFTFTIGTSIYVSGVSPSAWNGTYAVTGSSSTSVTFSLSGSALSWVSGGTVEAPAFNIGASIQVSSVSPSAWNGNFVVTGSTPTSVTYALSGSALSWSSGGCVADIGGDVTMTYNIVGAGDDAQTVFGTNWSLDNWGEYLVSLPVGCSAVQYNGASLPYGPIYIWDPIFREAHPGPITAGPPISTGVFVAMPQRQVIAWGTTFTGIVDPLLIRWCDVSNYNVWIGQITNQAGSYRLSTGSVIVGGMQANNQGLIWTDIGLWSMQYIGPPYIYSFNQIAQGCGLIGRKAAGVMNGVVYWMGFRQFFNYSENGVQPILCPVWDVIFQQLDQANLAKITIAVNSLFEEVTWYFPVTGGNGECSAYVKYSLLTNMWDIGTLGRSSWMDTSVLGPPMGYDPVNQYVYQHEISPDADGVAMTPSFTTGWFAISDGQNKAFLDEVWPDFKWGYYDQSQGASVQITFNAADFPGQTPTTYGPYPVTQSTQWFNTRIRSRLLSITISSSDLGSFWRTGALRYRVAPDGRY